MFIMNGIGSLFEFAGGIGMFLYGMNRMADGMQKSAGGKMKSLLGYLTRNRFLAILVGALITAIIQSSGATTVMVVGFVNAGPDKRSIAFPAVPIGMPPGPGISTE